MTDAERELLMFIAGDVRARLRNDTSAWNAPYVRKIEKLMEEVKPGYEPLTDDERSAKP